MKRCFKPPGFGKIVCCSLHHFSDASQNGSGQLSCLRLVDEKGSNHCCLVMGKSRVAPTKFTSTPRLELAAAALSVKVSVLLRKELTIHPIINKYFYADSQVALGYIENNAKRFKIFVESRVQLIREHSEPSQWTYIELKNNPADETSHDLSPSNLEKIEHWVKGPEFLWEEESRWPQSKEKEVNNIIDDLEVKKTAAVNVSKIEEDIVSILQIRLSNWVIVRLLRVVAWVIKFTKIIPGKLNKIPK